MPLVSLFDRNLSTSSSFRQSMNNHPSEQVWISERPIEKVSHSLGWLPVDHSRCYACRPSDTLEKSTPPVVYVGSSHKCVNEARDAKVISSISHRLVITMKGNFSHLGHQLCPSDQMSLQIEQERRTRLPLPLPSDVRNNCCFVLSESTSILMRSLPSTYTNGCRVT